jgi:diguanylate cyclase (GGDEF)-like protein
MKKSRPPGSDSRVGLSDLRIQNHRFDVALNNLIQGVCFFDGSRRLILANRRFAEIYGISPDAIKPGTTLEEIVERRVAVNAGPNMSAEEYLAWRGSIAVSDEPSDTIVELKNGRIISIHHRPMPDRGWVSTHEDITERLRIEERLAHMAHHDALTGLANRAMLRDHLTKLARKRTRGSTLALLCLDLDHFKQINDEYGHEAGDALLCAAARRLRRAVRHTDLVARLGSDEFVIVQTGGNQPARATAMAERLVEAFRQPFPMGDQLIPVGTSVGIAIEPANDVEPDTILTHAEIALSTAKSAGRGTFRFFEPEMDARARARRALEKDLRAALDNNELELFYQPKLDTQAEILKGFEALIRWRHPERGLVSPAEFIPLAEELGLIIPVGNQVLRQACMQAAKWPEDITVAVNLSPVQFQDSDIVAIVRDALERSGLDPVRLELEITETLLLRDTAPTLATLRELRELGVHISLDDFGTGYSSIAYLSRFPFDRIKIDQSFVRDLNVGTHALAIVRAIITLGQALGISITAEGVETLDQLAVLRAERCLEVQGYLFSRPVPEADVPALIARFGLKIGIAA